MTTTRRATCRCSQLAAVCEGEPFRVSVCHCLDCQKRSDSAFAAQARFPDAIAVAVGAFADPGFPPPRVSVWEKRKHPWVSMAGDGIEHHS